MLGATIAMLASTSSAKDAGSFQNCQLLDVVAAVTSTRRQKGACETDAASAAFAVVEEPSDVAAVPVVVWANEDVFVLLPVKWLA